MARMMNPVSTKTKITLNGHKVRIGGVAEIAAALGVAPTRVSTWMTRREQNGCPQALFALRMGGVYDLDEWSEWARSKEIDLGSFVPVQGASKQSEQ